MKMITRILLRVKGVLVSGYIKYLPQLSRDYGKTFVSPYSNNAHKTATPPGTINISIKGGASYATTKN